MPLNGRRHSIAQRNNGRNRLTAKEVSVFTKTEDLRNGGGPLSRWATPTSESFASFNRRWGGIFFECTRKDRPRSKRIWTWRLYGPKVLGFLSEIEPYLVSKGERARDVITFLHNGQAPV